MEKLCTRYGNVMSINQVQLEDHEDFTHSFHVVFFRIQSARFAKKQIDTKNFFGSVLHVCYAPELESIEQTRAKLQIRITEVTKHINRTGVANNYKKELSQQIPVTSDDNLKFQDLSSYSQKHNRWLKGGLKCSYIIPKTDPLNTTKEIMKHKLETSKECTKLNSKTSMFIPRQLSTASSTTKTKKPNRIIFHL
ncbi:Hypothetical protein CINCED_3A012556 [Cinara cedri]|nr:Hypothetical protein CINCED_3A012556 [Cinara cedri]